MLNCAKCQLFQKESLGQDCLHVNRPGGLELTGQGIELCNLPLGAKALDVACGTSTTLAYLKDECRLNPIGLDLSYEMLGIGKRLRPDLDMIQSDGGLIPLPGQSCQVVLAECAVSLMGSTVEALREFYRLLSPDGKLMLTDIYIREKIDPEGLNSLSATNCLTGARTEAEIMEQLLTAGFGRIVWRDYTQLFKQWLARMVFSLGSLDAIYRQLAACPADAPLLGASFSKKIKLGYYLLVAEKAN